MKTLFQPNEQGTLIVPPNIQRMMTGAASIFVIHPRYRVTYIDGSTEECTLPDSEQDKEFMALVGAVQAKRILR